MKIEIVKETLGSETLGPETYYFLDKLTTVNRVTNRENIYSSKNYDEVLHYKSKYIDRITDVSNTINK